MMFAIDVLDDNSNAGAKWETGSAERPSGDGFDATNHEYGWAGCWVGLSGASPSLNAVGYQIIRSTIKDMIGLPRYMLYRSVVIVEDTVDNSITSGFDLTSAISPSNGDVTTLSGRTSWQSMLWTSEPVSMYTKTRQRIPASMMPGWVEA